jgi:hypothetical protein
MDQFVVRLDEWPGGTLATTLKNNSNSISVASSGGCTRFNEACNRLQFKFLLAAY